MTSNKLKHKAKLQEWSLAVQECRSSGKPVKQWCSENKIKVTTYYRWEREILGTAGKSRNKPEHDGTADIWFWQSYFRISTTISSILSSGCSEPQIFT